MRVSSRVIGDPRAGLWRLCRFIRLMIAAALLHTRML